MIVHSPSLECDSGEEDILGHSYPFSSLSQQSTLRSSSGGERDSFDASPDFSRTQSDITHKSTKVYPFPSGSQNIIISLYKLWIKNVSNKSP